MSSRLNEFYKSDVAPQLMKKFGYKSTMQIPKLEKVVINVGDGECKDNPKVLEAILSDLQIITFCGERFCKRFANDVKTDLPEKESIVIQDLFCAGGFRDLQCKFQTVFQRDERTVADRDGAWDRDQVGCEKMFSSVCHGV